MKIHWMGWVALAGAGIAGGCAASPYDFPVATMIGNQRAYTMTGFAKGRDDADRQARVLKRFRPACPAGAKMMDWKAQLARNPHIVRYEAIATCKS